MSAQEKEVARLSKGAIPAYALPATGNTVTVTNTAQTIEQLLAVIPLPIPDTAIMARLQFEGDPVRMWENGVPTISEGLLMSDGVIYDLDIRPNFEQARFILASGSSSATIQIQFYR